MILEYKDKKYLKTMLTCGITPGKATATLTAQKNLTNCLTVEHQT